jgi:hypothetical protein
MSSEKRKESSATPRKAARIALALVFAAAAAAPAGAVTFYKWIDDRGQVHYGDAPPKAFAGTARRIDVDIAPHAAAQPRPPVAQPVAVPEPPAAAPDLLTQRRLTRARLEKNLEDARARLDLARKALAETVSPQEGELQVTQGQPLPAGSVAPGQSNCTSIATPNGARVVCPHLIPGEKYYERIDQMQEAVRVAEQAVEDAELAYRRGVD